METFEPKKEEPVDTLVVEKTKTPEPVVEEKPAAEEKLEEKTEESTQPAIDQAGLEFIT